MYVTQLIKSIIVNTGHYIFIVLRVTEQQRRVTVVCIDRMLRFKVKSKGKERQKFTLAHYGKVEEWWKANGIEAFYTLI